MRVRAKARAKLGAKAKYYCILLLYINTKWGEQVMRGHNIVADGWAGVSKPHPYSTPKPILKKYMKRLFFHFYT